MVDEQGDDGAVESTVLTRLCARFGVQRSFLDIWGREHVAPVATQVALLAEMGVDASSGEAALAAEAAAERAAGAEALPPVLVVAAEQAEWIVPVRLSEQAATAASTGSALRWTIRLEDGSLRQGDGIAESQPGAGSLRMSVPLPAGYHHLRLDGRRGETLVIAAPEHGYLPPGLAGDGRVWGPAIQLYGLRSQRNWGIGDFGDLLTAIEQWAGRGADLIGLNPLHALFPHNPRHASPYSPSSRLHLNTLYLDVERVADLAECEAARRLIGTPAFQHRLAELRASELVDYAGVAAQKTQVLRLLHASFAERHLGASGSDRSSAFREFETARGEPLRQHALYDALQAHFHAADPAVWGWPVWPDAYRSARSPEVERFAREHAAQVQYFIYLQWLAEGQLEAARHRCQALGMSVGLYLDLAVSVDRAGSDAWGYADIYALGASVGAPADEVNRNGQGWGLPPLQPERSRQSGHALFIASLRASMRHAGALRIDHVMGLMRLYWIPPGQPATRGAYVLYPLDELIAIVALESQRNRCLVIGEDLGTVADAIRTAMAANDVLSYRLLYFERSADGAFLAPADFPAASLVAVSTHDLASLAGWWSGHDLLLRESLGLFADAAAYEQQLATRAQDRVRLLFALQREGLLPAGMEAPLGTVPAMTPALSEAIHAHTAASASKVMLLQLEDALGAVDQANMPGTVDEHPNWRRKLALGLEAQAGDAGIDALAARIAAQRPRPQAQGGATPRRRAVIPRATYRLQFHPGFDFDAGVAVLPYLRRLGISHVYCSPILRARAGSTHGYDVVAHDEINPELGGAAGFERFTSALHAQGMGQLLDMVPNHMGVLGTDNAWWIDVLENGPASPFSRHFDIDWHPVNRELEGKVLLPVLGDHYGNVLDRGELRLRFEAATGSLALGYFEHCFPLDPSSYDGVLQAAAQLVDDAAATAQLQSLAAAFGHLPRSDAEAHSAAAEERIRDKELLKARLAELVAAREPAGQAMAAAVAAVNAAVDGDAVHALHDRQAYRLAYWRVAADEINYRRFFDINELAALRMEEPAVFEATQGFSLDLAAAGKVDGLRIDHPDGLQDPAQYFQRLQQGYARRLGRPADGAAGEAAPRLLYVVAEKIAAAHEDVPAEWQIHGATGYRFAMIAGGVLVDGDAEAEFERIWQAFSGTHVGFAELVYQGKRAVTRTALASELTVLATALLRIARADRHTRDYTFNSLRDALAEIAACMPVYRTYIVDQPSVQDDRFIDWALAQARRRSRLVDLSIFDFARACLRNQPAPAATPAEADAVHQFALRFQQFCSPVAAKGVEDTAFYRYHRLVSLNEVGGDPAAFGITPRAFHGSSIDRAARWPHTLLATSTHDNKRSEDVRNRISVLSEMPAAWEEWLLRWHAQTAGLRTREGDELLPAAADEYLLYQTLLGTLPAGGLDDDSLAGYRERIGAYMRKATREAKQHTSWMRPNEIYESALQNFVGGVLARVRPNPVLSDLQLQAKRLAWFGALNSLTTVLLKYTAPGVPDLYQGNELIDLSLVDPDNRRPVDYALRAALLDELSALAASPQLAERVAALAEAPHDGRAKLWLTWRLLTARAELPEFFTESAYVPLVTGGARREHVLAYGRQLGDTWLIVVAGRLFSRLPAGAGQLPTGEAVWGDTAVELPTFAEGSRLEHLLTGQRLAAGSTLRLADAFAHVPAAAYWLRRPA